MSDLDLEGSEEDECHAEFEACLVRRYSGVRAVKSVKRRHEYANSNSLAWITEVKSDRAGTIVDAPFPAGFEGLSGTSIATLYARDFHYNDGPFLCGPLHRVCADYLHIHDLYRQMFPACKEPYEFALFLAMREQVMMFEIEQAVQRGEIKNVLVLAAGISPLPIGLVELTKDVPVIATDLADLAAKQRQLKNFVRANMRNLRLELPVFSANHQRLQVEPLDVLAPEQWEKVDERLQPGGVGVVCEGLMPYMNLEQWEIIMVQIRRVLAKYGGFFVTDIATRQGKRKTIFSADSENLLKKFYDQAGIPTEGLAFDSSVEYDQFMVQRGFNSHTIRLGRSVYRGPLCRDDPYFKRLATNLTTFAPLWLQRKLAVPINQSKWDFIVNAPICRRITLVKH